MDDEKAEEATTNEPRRKYPKLVSLVSRQLLMVEISHERLCEPLGKCLCTPQIVARGRRSNVGVRGIAKVERTFPPAVSFPAGVMVALPETVLEEPGIAAALASKRLRVAR